MSCSSFSLICRLAVHVRLFEVGENYSSFLPTEFYSYPINLPGFETGSLVPCFGRVTLTTNCLHLKIIHNNSVLSQKLAHSVLEREMNEYVKTFLEQLLVYNKSI